MHASIATLALALTLTATLAPLATAGSTSISIKGPEKDGTYLVSAYSCHEQSKVWTASAEGIVHGQRKSVPIQLKATKETGVYRFAHVWPSEGTWFLRVAPCGGPKMVALAAVSSDGRVGDSEYLWDTDGRRECDVKLAANTK